MKGRDYSNLAVTTDERLSGWGEIGGCLDVPVVEDEGTQKEKHFTRKFLVGKPHFQAPGVAGRATRGYVALPLNASNQVKGPFVYLKDAWRVVREGIEQEGSILAELNQLKIENVPTLLYHGDIPGQATISQDIWATYHPNDKGCPLKLHQHYRLVVKEVGKPLEQFRNGFELVWALFCCIEAHQAAHEHGIIHRDISAGNILLWYDPKNGWVGMLNDWELSKRVPASDVASGGRQPDRTGTWQFMSAHALNDRFRPIVVADELEAFLHVLLYYAIRFLSHNCTAVGQFLHLYFDDYTDGNGQFNCGQMKYGAMRTGVIDLALLRSKSEEDKGKKSAVEPLRFYKPGSTAKHPIQTILEALLLWFNAYYALDNAQAEEADDSGSPSPQDSGLPEFPKGFFAKEKIYAKSDSAKPASLNAPPPTTATVRVQKATPIDSDADKVQTHAAMLSLLMHELRQRENWSANDKGPDKRPKKGYKHPKDPIPASSTQLSLASGTTGTTGTKRKADRDENPRTPKKQSKA